MKKITTLCSVVMALTVVNLHAATATQKAAFKAEKKATVVAVAAAKKATAAINKASVLETKALAALSALSPGSAVKTPEEFIVARQQAATDKYTELWTWTTLSDSQIALANASWTNLEKEAAASEKAFYNTLTPAEKVAYKASLAAAIAIEAAGTAIDEAATAAEYANKSIAERIEYNDYWAAYEDAIAAEAALLSPAQLKVAKVAYFTEQYADMGDFYIYCANLSPSERQAEFAAAIALDPDPATADDIVIADGARFE